MYIIDFTKKKKKKKKSIYISLLGLLAKIKCSICSATLDPILAEFWLSVNLRKISIILFECQRKENVLC